MSEFKAAVLDDHREVNIKPLLKKIKNVKMLFNELSLTIYKLKKAFNLKNEEEMKKEFEKIDTDASGTIGFSEFS